MLGEVATAAREDMEQWNSSPGPTAPAPDPRPVPAASRRRCGGGPRCSGRHGDGVEGGGKVSGERENVEMVVEVTGESGEAGKEMDLTGVAIEVLRSGWRHRKQKNVVKDSGDKKARRLEDTAAATDTSDQEYTSDGSELSNMVVDSEIKSFLTQTKGMRGPDSGIYFPDKLLFIQSASHWIKHQAASDLTDPEIFRLKKHMVKTRKQLRELSNKSTSL
ncbi:hypothetical protein D4764_22G0006860 [Takifugu flavidus]|uniref:Uncharacterized protein n=1 Tax=Takifugu flavidus TaxID=433684 RepID=A0A5C6NE84_9TELE|nr:hypothetical protein D4764_22G0006860 [Takifugu flavidus]